MPVISDNPLPWRARLPTQHHLAFFVLLFSLLVAILDVSALAQDSGVDARAASVTGAVLLATPGGGATALTRGLALSPGDAIDTRGGGRAVIELSDGSIVEVQPGSVVTLKDYRQAANLRELFSIAVGRVRVKINHFPGRPNPYRMNSPTASIAVRGTEFVIDVDGVADTRVIVYEGLVEVASLRDPARKALIEGGRGVLVTPGMEFQLFTAPARDMDDRAGSPDHDRNSNPANNRAQNHAGPNSQPGPGSGSPPAQPSGPGTPPVLDHDESSPRAAAGAYERYIANVASVSNIPLLLRFNAVPELYLDSMENPAYATGFHQAEGRLYLLPSLSGIPDSLEGNPAVISRSVPADYNMSSQTLMFVPFHKGRFVLGGGTTGSYGSNVAGSGTDYDGPLISQPAPDRITSGQSTDRFLAGNLLGAINLGRSSFGFEAESLRVSGSVVNRAVDPMAGGMATEVINSHSDILQTRLTAGFKTEIARGQTLGAFFRYGFVNAQNSDLSHTLNGVLQPLDFTNSPGHTTEFGLRLRGAATPRLLYGVEAAWLGLSLSDSLVRGGLSASEQRDRAQRESLGLGLAYFLGRRTALFGDFALGQYRISASRSEDLTALLLQNGIARSRFASIHGAIQYQFTSRIFGIVSYLNTWQDNRLGLALFPDSIGRIQAVSDTIFFTSPSAYVAANHLSDFGLGWMITPHVLAQYVFSTDYGFSSPTHALMLRYTFHLHKDE